MERVYGVRRERFLRPFWPGAEYREAEYPEGCCVVDNPPFSILGEIVKWYCKRGIPFFLFGPSLTLFTARECDVCYIAAGADIVYENGANVKTGFVTNLDDVYRIRTAPELYQAIKRACERIRKEGKRELPKYSYPDHLITAAAAQQLSIHGTELKIRKDECRRVSGLDAQAEQGKSAFGGGYLLSDRAAAERAAAERAAAERAAAERAAATRWTLSERERRMVEELNRQSKRGNVYE